MSGEYIVFLALALVSIMGGTIMLISKKVMYMTISLIFTFISIAGIYILLSAEFVAVVQVMIYSGAVAILMIFGIMLTDHKDEQKQKGSWLKKVLTGVAVIIFAISMFVSISQIKFTATDVALHENNTEKIGIAMFTDYLIPFEIASLVLLVTLVGAILIAKKEPTEGGEK